MRLAVEVVFDVVVISVDVLGGLPNNLRVLRWGVLVASLLRLLTRQIHSWWICKQVSVVYIRVNLVVLVKLVGALVVKPGVGLGEGSVFVGAIVLLILV